MAKIKAVAAAAWRMAATSWRRGGETAAKIMRWHGGSENGAKRNAHRASRARARSAAASRRNERKRNESEKRERRRISYGGNGGVAAAANNVWRNGIGSINGESQKYQ
jgi:hypothetical protein